jgi:hypothetical protein
MVRMGDIESESGQIRNKAATTFDSGHSHYAYVEQILIANKRCHKRNLI